MVWAHSQASGHLFLVDAATAITEAALAFLEVVADFVDLLDRARGTRGGGCGSIHSAMGEATLVAAFAGAVTEVEALATRAGSGTGLALGRLSRVREPALVTHLTVAFIAESEADTTAALATTRGCGGGFAAMGEFAFITTLAHALITEGEAYTRTARCATTGTGTTAGGLHRALVLAAALFAKVAATCLVVAADFLADITSAASIILTVGEAAAIAVRTGTLIAPVEALATGRADLRGSNRLTLRVQELALIAEAATTVVAECAADLLRLRHLK